MNSTSPAHSSVSTTAVVGGGGGGGGGSGSNATLEDFHFPCDLISIQDRKEEAMLVLKADLMAALNKEVKSLDEDSWKFEAPRSRIHLISRPGAFINKKMEIANSRSFAPPK
ncbi:protein SAMBA [Euphorbia lathyris]|uniref:protein SAMBA n=1 Tax=Euphorbia lathyris TaxID=212925 RepID=UPI003313B334